MREAANPLDPDALTLGFAQRFTGYKRPNLLVENLVRLSRPLNDPARPVHLVLAGKAHPADSEGKKMIRDWIAIAAEHVDGETAHRKPEATPRESPAAPTALVRGHRLGPCRARRSL
jgi:glucan phosphorylase